jgi:hypothetical protein
VDRLDGGRLSSYSIGAEVIVTWHLCIGHAFRVPLWFGDFLSASVAPGLLSVEIMSFGYMHTHIATIAGLLPSVDTLSVPIRTPPVAPIFSACVVDGMSVTLVDCLPCPVSNAFVATL